MTGRPTFFTAAIAVGALALTACGSSDEDLGATATGAPSDQATQGPETSDTTSEPEAPDDADTGDEDVDEAEESPEPTSGGDEGSAEDQESEDAEQEAESEPGPPQGPPSGGVPQAADEDLPGDEPTASTFGEAGDEVGVAGLDPNDAPLEVYALPGEDSEVVAELQPTDAVVLTGRERNLNTSTDEGQGIWTEVQLADGYGWSQTAPFLYFGSTEDVTSDYIDEVPPTEEPRALAESVGERATGGEPGEDDAGEDADAYDYGPRWVVITEPEDFGEEFYRVDVTGAMSDSGAGHRFFVHVEQQADGYQLTEVEATALCYRGVGESGLCR